MDSVIDLRPKSWTNTITALLLAGVVLLVLIAVWWNFSGKSVKDSTASTRSSRSSYEPSRYLDSSGFIVTATYLQPWDAQASLTEVKKAFTGLASRAIDQLDTELAKEITIDQRATNLFTKASIANYEGNTAIAYEALQQARKLSEDYPALGQQALYSCIMFQGICALRRGENENCILCRGESSCILPISSAAIHTNPTGSRLAIQHFTEYLEQFPDDLEVRWLLNLAHMTLGEHPQKVDPRFLVRINSFLKSEFDIGQFRDIGHLVGVNKLNQAGGAIMDDFDNDGLLDIVTTEFSPETSMTYFHNAGNGHFEDRTKATKLDDMLGGLNCVQGDYNNDGRLDIFVVRGAWMSIPIRPSLLRNNADGTFTDVTEEAGLMNPANSITASWADYDNDGWLDLFVCAEKQPSRLYRNLRDETFEDVTAHSGLFQDKLGGKGVAWIDYDNDGRQDLFVNYHTRGEGAQLFQNKGDGTFRDVTWEMGIEGPVLGFSCWAWDYDNDGWLDIFATSYDTTLKDVVKGLQGEPHQVNSGRLYHNLQGKRFEDVTRAAGLDMAFSTMGSNFGDFDNDGFLDMYLSTGEPTFSHLVPNRMFKNVAGQRFSEITTSSRTGNLQKGHGVACGDWDRDGNTDLFLEMGGAVAGDQYHNILFQNPGHRNDWLTVKLSGVDSNRSAIGARIKVVTSASPPQTIYRHITSGSSFGANPLQQTIGLGRSNGISRLEIHWPSSGKTQVFHNLQSNQAIEITESATEFRKLNWTAIPVPTK